MPDLPQTTCELIDQAADRFGERPAIVDGELRMSYADVAAEARRLRRGLVASGVRAADRVAISSPNTAHWVTAALAIHSAGAALVPLNARFTGREAFDLLARTGASMLLLPDRFLDTDYLETLRSAAPPMNRDRPVPWRGCPTSPPLCACR